MCEHEVRQKRLLKEISIMILVHFCFNVILFYPVWVTGSFPVNIYFFNDSYFQPGMSTECTKLKYCHSARKKKRRTF